MNFVIWSEPNNVIQEMCAVGGRYEWHFSTKHVYGCHQQTPSLEENLNQSNISTDTSRPPNRCVFFFVEIRLLGKSTKAECSRMFTCLSYRGLNCVVTFKIWNPLFQNKYWQFLDCRIYPFKLYNGWSRGPCSVMCSVGVLAYWDCEFDSDGRLGCVPLVIVLCY
jgi:hypothetical protein